MLKVSVFCLEKHKCFIPKKNMIQALVPKQAKRVPTDSALPSQFSLKVLVEGITCDNYVDNTKVAKSLGVTEDNPKFPNPSPKYAGEWIYWMYDPVHLLKLIRNHLIDQGLQRSIFFPISVNNIYQQSIGAFSFGHTLYIIVS